MEQKKINGWLVIADRYAGYMDDTVVLHIFDKPQGARSFVYHGPKGAEVVTHNEDRELPKREEMEWRIPVGAIPALCAVLQDQDPASERLTKKLEDLLEREAGRVDRLIEAKQPFVVNGVLEA